MQVSEIDETGNVLATFTDVMDPTQLLVSSKDHLMVADCLNHRILLLTSDLQLLRVLVDKSSAVGVQWPSELSYNELTSQLHVLHGVPDLDGELEMVSLLSLPH